MIEVLYIAGSGRSGSTLLERILGQIDSCVAVGELRHIWQRNPERELCGCGQLMTACDFWNRIMGKAGIRFDAIGFQDMYALQRSVDRIRFIPNMYNSPLTSHEYRSQFVQYTTILKKLYLAIQAENHSRIIIDSSKDMSTLYMLLNSPEIRVRILHMIRDSRAVAFSWMREKVRPHAVDYLSMMPTYSPQKTALDWTYRNLMTEFVRNRAHAYMQLRYEDLLADPLTTTAGITRFMELEDVDLSYIAPAEVKLIKDNHTVAGNPMRFKKGDIRLQLDDAWRQDLKPAHQKIVTALTWPLLRRYHYGLTTKVATVASAYQEDE